MRPVIPACEPESSATRRWVPPYQVRGRPRVVVRGRTYQVRHGDSGCAGSGSSRFQIDSSQTPRLIDESSLGSGRGAGVFGHAQVIEDQACIAIELSHFLCYAAYAFGFDDSNGQSPQSGDVFDAVARTDSTPVFVVIPINNVMAAILDGPMAPIHVEDTLWVGFIDLSTGDAVNDFTRAFAGLFLCRVSLDEERLSEVGKVQVAVQFGCGPNLSDFDSSMIGGCILNEIRLLAILEQ